MLPPSRHHVQHVSGIRRRAKQETIKCLNPLTFPGFYFEDYVDKSIICKERFPKNVVTRRAISITLVHYSIQSVNGVMGVVRSQGQDVGLRFVPICPRM